MSDNKKVWFITGCSTGLGRALTNAALQKGYQVVATARKPEQLNDIVDRYPGNVKAVRLDITKPEEVRDAVRAAIDTFGRIDVLVNNAGRGLLGALEEVSDEAIREMFEVNLFGHLDVTRVILPIMRQQRSGHILNLSSVAGFIGAPGVGVYCVTKFALEGLSEVLSKEVAPFGIKVTVVEPGEFRTNFRASYVTSDTVIDDYASTSGAVIKHALAGHGKQKGDPAKAALAMIQVVESDNSPMRLPLGTDAVRIVEMKLESVKTELDAWRVVAEDTAFDEG